MDTVLAVMADEWVFELTGFIGGATSFRRRFGKDFLMVYGSIANQLI
jgi:hypothetical protein